MGTFASALYAFPDWKKKSNDVHLLGLPCKFWVYRVNVGFTMSWCVKCWVYYVNDSVVARSNGLCFVRWYYYRLVTHCVSVRNSTTISSLSLFWKAKCLHVFQRKETIPAWVSIKSFQLQVFPNFLFQSYIYFQLQVHANDLVLIVPSVLFYELCFSIFDDVCDCTYVLILCAYF